jgi:hypothetical protein
MESARARRLQGDRPGDRPEWLPRQPGGADQWEVACDRDLADLDQQQECATRLEWDRLCPRCEGEGGGTDGDLTGLRDREARRKQRCRLGRRDRLLEGRGADGDKTANGDQEDADDADGESVEKSHDLSSGCINALFEMRCEPGTTSPTVA